MKKIVWFTLASVISVGVLNASEVGSVEDMFKNGEISGQIRFGYHGIDFKDATTSDTYVSAIGGQLKYESASLYGVSSGVAIYTSNSVSAMSGSGDKFGDTLASSEKNFTELAEAYLNYKRDGLNLRVGRQVLDTPLADSDDWVITPHTFEAVVASYRFEDLGLSVVGANVQRWQGVDSGYENVTTNSWADTGDNGTNMLALLYANDTLESGIWYYDVDKAAKAIYGDITASFELGTDTSLSIGIQYLNESEDDNSKIDGSIAGVMAKLSYDSLVVSGAYNSVNVDNGTKIFKGFGGGVSYTNMFITTVDDYCDTTHEDASSYKLDLEYGIGDIVLYGGYAQFDANGTGDKSEMDLVAKYIYNDGVADISLGYVKIRDKIDSTASLDRVQLFANYNF